MLEKQIFAIIEQIIQNNEKMANFKFVTGLQDGNLTRPLISFVPTENIGNALNFSLYIYSDYCGLDQILSIQNVIKEQLQNYHLNIPESNFVFRYQKSLLKNATNKIDHILILTFESKKII